MTREIIGSMAVRETGFVWNNKRFQLIFTRDRLIVLNEGLEIAEFIDRERGTIDRGAVLSADVRNFEIPYLEIRSVTMKQGGFSFGWWYTAAKVGSIRIETFTGSTEYQIDHGQDYRICARTVAAALGNKLNDKSKGPAYRYCPECREEYQEWVTVCPDCDVVLVDELPLPELEIPERGNAVYTLNDESALDDDEFDHVSSDGLVSIAVAPNDLIAEMWKGLLDEQGIPCMVKRTGHLAHSRYYAPGVGNCEIIVPVSAAKRAFRILQPFLDV